MITALACVSMAFGQTAMVSSHASTLSNSAASGAPLAVVQPATDAMKPAVRVNGAVLIEADVVREMYTIFPYASQHNGFPKGIEADIRKGAIEMIIFEELIYQQAKRLKVPLAPERLSKAEDEFRKQFASKAAYNQYLQNECAGSRQVLREKIRRSLLIDKMLQTQVEEKSVITVAEAKAYYDNNANKFSKPESYRLQTISILPPQNGGAAVEKEARKRAEEAYERAKATKTFQDFGLLAEKISEDDWHVSMGDRKLVEASKLPPPIVKALAVMKPGEVSNLIQLGNAYTIVRLIEHAPASRTSFEAVRAGLQSDLQKQKRAELRAALNRKLRQDAKIEVL
jgi:parvulin-like peptidyl-prolyl isomerase